MSTTTQFQVQSTPISHILLAGIAALSLAACVFVASFLIARHDLNVMQQTGYYLWSNAASWDGSSSNPLSADEATVWYNYQPGAKLQLVLEPAPAYAATRAAIAIFLSAAALIPVLIWQIRRSWRLRTLFIVISAISFCASLYLFMPAPPAGFTIDMKAQLITINGVATGAQIQMTRDMTIGITPSGVVSWLGYNLVLQNNHYGNLKLAEGTYEALNTICNLAMTFINAGGNQI